MKLLTKKIIKRFKEVGSQEKEEDPIIIVKFFGGANWTWFATEYNEEEKIFYGYVKAFGNGCDEWGSFSLEELEGLRFKPFGLRVERDMWFGEKRFSEVKYN